MEDEEINFDEVVAAPQPSVRKLGRLKKAGINEAKMDPATPAAPAPLQSTSSALLDMTNLQPARSDAPPQSPAASQMSAEASASQDLTSAQSPSGSAQSAHVKASPAQSHSEQDYWDSEDELEAELTKRERAEGFHAASPSASGCNNGCCQHNNYCSPLASTACSLLRRTCRKPPRNCTRQ